MTKEEFRNKVVEALIDVSLKHAASSIGVNYIKIADGLAEEYMRGSFLPLANVMALDLNVEYPELPEKDDPYAIKVAVEKGTSLLLEEIKRNIFTEIKREDALTILCGLYCAKYAEPLHFASAKLILHGIEFSLKDFLDGFNQYRDDKIEFNDPNLDQLP